MLIKLGSNKKRVREESGGDVHRPIIKKFFFVVVIIFLFFSFKLIYSDDSPSLFRADRFVFAKLKSVEWPDTKVSIKG